MESDVVSEEVNDITTEHGEKMNIDEVTANGRGCIPVTDENAVAISSNKFCVAYSKRGTAKCKICKKIIRKGELRMGMYAPYKGKEIINYYHVPCSFGKMLKARVESNSITNIIEIDGFESLLTADQLTIENFLQDNKDKRTTPLLQTYRKKN